MSPALWTDEYFMHHIERVIKYQIDMKFFVNMQRKPTREDYQEIFKEWVGKLKCEVTDYDLGIYE